MNDSVVFEEFPWYEVTTDGQVRNYVSERIMTPHMNGHGIVCISIQDKDGVQRQRSLAKLVAEAYLPKPESIYEEFNTPINLDYDRWNCAVDNLAWRPRWFSYQYHQQRDFAIKYHNTTPIRDLESGIVYYGTWEVCTIFGLLEEHLRRALIMGHKVFPTMQEFDWADR